MSSAVNFSSLSTLTAAGSADEILVRIDNSLSGASGFGKIEKKNFLSNIVNDAGTVTTFESTTVGAARIKIQGVDRSAELACEISNVPGGYQGGLMSLGSLGMQGNLAGISFSNSNATYQYGAIGPDAYNGFKYMLGNPGILSGANAGVTLMYFSSAENVGINTEAPNEKFTVNGNISSNGNIYGTFTGTLSAATYVATVSSTTVTNYVLQLADASRTIIDTAATTTTYSVPANSVTSFAIGTQIIFIQGDKNASNYTRLSAGVGVTINSFNGSLSLAGDYAAGTLIKTDTDTWYLIGNLA